MQMEEARGPRALMMKNSPKVLVTMKAHQSLMTETMMYQILSIGVFCTGKI
jgi:hypothetical protein